jgi:structural maintenance of chromosome 4
LEKEKLLSLQEEMQKANEELNELNLKEKKLYDSVNKSRMKCSEAQSSFSANRNRNKVLSFLMQLKSEGKVPGLFGRLVS